MLFKRNLSLICTLVLALVFVGTSCKKDDDKTSKDFLTDHEWKLTGYTIAGISGLEECDKDNIYNFHEDGDYHQDAGATKCEDTELQEITGNWSISSSTTPETITITYDSNALPTYEAKITDLDEDKMILTVEFNVGGVTSTEVRTFEKI